MTTEKSHMRPCLIRKEGIQAKFVASAKGSAIVKNVFSTKSNGLFLSLCIA